MATRAEMVNTCRAGQPAQYLGDGLYASNDGCMITLVTDREDGQHYIALEPEVFEALIQYAMTIGWLK